ncbi:MAG TPA: GNAT family acetyltransferase [Acidimicrobiales bacterium]
MEAVELEAADEASVVALWASNNLTRPWNDPAADYSRAVFGPTSAVLGLKDARDIVGTVMVGHDGHRSWMYYLAVRQGHQRRGYGRLLVSAAETWLRNRGAVKVQLMVRSENTGVLHFYEDCGYEHSDVQVLSRWLKD